MTANTEIELASDYGPKPSPEYLASYYKAGLPLFALKKFSATVWGAKKREKVNVGKMPLLDGWRTQSPMNQERAENWMASGGNVGVRLPADWMVIDIDPRNGATPEVRRKLCERFGIDLDKCPIVRSGRGDGGFHIYLRNPQHHKIHKGLADFPGVDFLSDGRYVLAAGALHPDTGKPYIHNGVPFADAPAAPDILFDALKFEPPALCAGDQMPFGEMGIDGVQGLLAHLDPTNYGHGNQEKWFGLMCSAHFLSGGLAEDEFAAWCRGDPQYDNDGAEKSVRLRWRSLSTSADHKLLNRMQLHKDLMDLGKSHLLPRPNAGKEFADMLDDNELNETLKQMKKTEPAMKNVVNLAEERAARVKPDEWDDILGASSAGPEGPEEKLIHEWNARIARVMHGGKSLIVEWRDPDPELKEGIKLGEKFVSGRGLKEPVFYELNELKKHNGHKRRLLTPPLEAKPKLMHELEFWDQSKDALRYDNAGYAPGRSAVYPSAGGQTFNLWHGWTYDLDHLRRADEVGELPATPWLDRFLIEVIADGDKKLLDYILNWVAFTYQRPDIAIGVMLVMKGLQGIGKGTLWQLWRAPWGLASFHASEPETLFGRFSGHLLHTSAIYADEAFFAGDKKTLGRLNAMITEPTVSIEDKGLKTVQIRNTYKFMAGSNERWVVPANEDARRYQVFSPSPIWKGDKDKFGALGAELDAGGRAAFFYRMMMRDISGFDPERDRVTTAATRQQAHATRGFIVDWLAEFIAAMPAYAFEDKAGLHIPKTWAREALESSPYSRSFTSDWRHSASTTFDHEIEAVLGPGRAGAKDKRAPASEWSRLKPSGDAPFSPWRQSGKAACMCWPRRREIAGILKDRYGVTVDVSGDDADLLD